MIFQCNMICVIVNNDIGIIFVTVCKSGWLRMVKMVSPINTMVINNKKLRVSFSVLINVVGVLSMN